MAHAIGLILLEIFWYLRTSDQEQCLNRFSVLVRQPSSARVYFIWNNSLWDNVLIILQRLLWADVPGCWPAEKCLVLWGFFLQLVTISREVYNWAGAAALLSCLKGHGVKKTMLVLFHRNTDVPRLCCDWRSVITRLCCKTVVGRSWVCMIKEDMFGCDWICCYHLWLYLFFPQSLLRAAAAQVIWRMISLVSLLLDLASWWRVLNTDIFWDMSYKQTGCSQFDVSMSAVLPDDKKMGLWSSCFASLWEGQWRVDLYKLHVVCTRK